MRIINEDVNLMRMYEKGEFWAGAKTNLKCLEDEGYLDTFFEALECLIDNCYPEGIEMTQLNDLIWFDWEWILGEEE